MDYFKMTPDANLQLHTARLLNAMKSPLNKMLLLAGVLAILGTGCVQRPAPLVVVEPSYAYTQDPEALAVVESWPTVALGEQSLDLPELVLVGVPYDQLSMTEVAFGSEPR